MNPTDPPDDIDQALFYAVLGLLTPSELASVIRRIQATKSEPPKSTATGDECK